MEPQRRIADAGGVQISWLDWKGGGRPALAIPGVTANARAFDGLARALAPAHRLIAMDLRGRGESDAPAAGYNVQTHAADGLALLDAAGIERAALIGWSLGGKVGLAMAALHPARVSHLVALDPPLVTSAAARATLRRFWARLTQTYPSVEAYVDQMADARLFGGRGATVEAYLRADVRRGADGIIRHRVDPRVPERELEAEDAYPTTVYLPRVRCPTLVLRSTEPITNDGDAVLSPSDAEVLVAGLQDGRLLELAGVNHFSMLLHDPPAVAAPIATFLDASP